MTRFALCTGGIGGVFLLACTGVDIPAPDANPPPSGEQSSQTECPEGTEIVEFWAGEYPEPVVWIDAPTDLPVRASPCAEPWRTCPVTPGLYHPWEARRPAWVGFATISTVERFEAVKPFELTDGVDTVTVAPGQSVEVPSYLGEGVCQYRVTPEGGGEPLEIAGQCPEMLGDTLKRLGPEVDRSERGTQLIRVSCEDSPEKADPILGWIVVDDALFAHDTIEKGQITGYGEVAPPEGKTLE